MLAQIPVLFYNRGHKRRKIMAAFGGWRLTRAGVLFVIGIIVLAGLVTGGVFLVKNRGESARRAEAVKVAEQELKDQSEVATQPVEEQTDKAAEEVAKADAEAAKAAATAKAEADKAAVAAATASQLPQTGPEEMAALGRILIVTILAVSVSFYVASRRAAKDL